MPRINFDVYSIYMLYFLLLYWLVLQTIITSWLVVGLYKEFKDFSLKERINELLTLLRDDMIGRL